jgi:hypothetical protein
MQSTISPSRLLRMIPYLMTVGLGMSVAANAAEPESPNDMPSEIPAPTIDTDGDGIMDAWDRSDDGQPDAWDSDGDGQADLLDENGDGQPD